MKKDIPLEYAETRSADAQRGFALVIALSLMAFILLLLLSITTLVRVETQSSEISLATLKARQNALLGLQIAIGELQEHTGVDQVATGTSEYIFGNTALLDPDAPGGPGDRVNQKHWTGVWTQSPDVEQPRHLMWLVSGNEAVDTDDTNVQHGSSLQTLLPARPMASNDPADSDYNQNDVWMVDQAVGNSVTDKVRVPAVEFDSGRYAWWASDESLKANVSVGRPADNTLGADDSELRVATAQRLTGSAMAGFSSLPEDEAALSALPNVETIQLLAPGITDADFEDRFHDITVHSRGLLSNSRDGGLKKDLTAAFRVSGSQFASLTSAYSSQIFPAVDEDGITVASSDDNPGGPTWAQLGSFVSMRPESGDGTGLGATKDLQRQTNTQMGVYPVISSFQLYTTLTENSSVVVPPGQKSVRFWLMPSVSFWNPYNVTISVPATHLRVTNNRSWTGGAGDDFRFVAWGFDSVDNSRVAGYFPGVTYPLTFTVPAFTIAPGATQIFSINSATAFSNPAPLSAGWTGTGGLTIDDAIAVTPGKTMDTFMIGAGDAQTKALFRVNIEWTLNNPGLNQVIPNDAIQVVANLWANELHDGRNSPFFTLSSVTDPFDEPKWGFAFRSVFSDFSADFASPGNNYDIYPRIPWLKVANPRSAFHNISPVEISNESSSSPASYRYGMPSQLPGAPNQPFQQRNYEYEPDFGSGVYSGGNIAKSHTILFELPQSNNPVLSIGQLMHANLGFQELDPNTYPITGKGNQWDIFNKLVSGFVTTARYQSLNNTPAYAIGNSAADPRIAPDKLAFNWNGSNFFNANNASTAANINSSDTRGWHYDYSYLLNRALWDDFFFSGVPSAGVGSLPLPHSLYEVKAGATTADLTDFDRAAANITQRGAFNVNSVSEDAWKAVLSAFLGESVESEAGDRSDPDEAPILRMIKPKLDAFDPASDAYFDDEAYAGFRRLTTAEIDSLAKAIVAKYKERRASVGPFVALADFVNRQVKRGATVAHKREGLLQAAIDPINDDEGDPASAVNGSWNLNYAFWEEEDQVIEFPNDLINNGYGDLGFHQLNSGVDAQMPEPDHLAGPVAFGAPGFLMQADILARIGNLLTVRGDTFKIRVYGESKDSLTGEVNSRAYGEAVIQRSTEYIDTTDNAETFPPTSTVNQDFGRRYKLVAFRWLDEDDV